MGMSRVKKEGKPQEVGRSFPTARRMEEGWSAYAKKGERERDAKRGEHDIKVERAWDVQR